MVKFFKTVNQVRLEKYMIIILKKLVIKLSKIKFKNKTAQTNEKIKKTYFSPMDKQQQRGGIMSTAYSKRLERQSSPTSRPNYKHRKGQPQTYPQVFASFESIQGVHFQGQKTKVLMNEDACPIYQTPVIRRTKTPGFVADSIRLS